MKILTPLLLLFLCVACADNKQAKITIDSHQRLQLSDSLFPLRDVQSSIAAKQFLDTLAENPNFLPDSLRRFAAITMDTFQLRALMVPIVTKDIDLIDAGIVVAGMTGRFISVQKKIGNFKPIVVSIDGDDYNALFYILLDDSFNTVSYLRIHGGFQPGPTELSDDTVQLPPDLYTTIQQGQLKSHIVTTSLILSGSLSDPRSFYDSVNYITTVLPSGKLKTQKLDSVRLEKMEN